MKDKDTELLVEAYSQVKWPPEPIDINNVDINSLQVGNVIRSQYPRFEDAIFTAGNFKDGKPLTENELEQLQGEQYDLFYDMLMNEFTSVESYSPEKNTNMLDMIDPQSVEIEGLERHEYPDFANAHIIYATYKNGSPLSHEELDQLNSEESTQLFIHDKIHGEQLYM